MKREIKFRAWDSKDKIIWNPLTISDLIEGGWELETKDQQSSLPQKDYLEFAHTDTIWMQSTFLHDKNGKEIYDGDIVRQSNNLCIIKSCVGGFECQMLLELKNGGTIEGSTYNFSFLSEKYCEVIGNIYQNSDLLHP